MNYRQARASADEVRSREDFRHHDASDWHDSRDGYMPASDPRLSTCEEMSPLMQRLALLGVTVRKRREERQKEAP